MEGVIESFELAFRMQTETPKLVDMSSESQVVKELYGIGQSPTDQFGRQCLLRTDSRRRAFVLSKFPWAVGITTPRSPPDCPRS